MKNFITFILLFSISLGLMSQGLGFNNTKYSEYEEFETESLGFSNLPSSSSLRKYAPSVLSQDGNSCVGFATAYSALSIMHNYRLGVTNKIGKNFSAFDPYFLYSILTSESDWSCEETTYMYSGLDALKKFGCKKYWAFPLLDCETKAVEKNLWASKPYRIKEFYILPKDKIKQKSFVLEKLKTAVVAVMPPVIGIKTTNSMAGKGYSDGTVGDDGLWKPNYYDKTIGGHAVCIVGYDDYKFGGSFEIMNSWGSDYGNDGYMWIKYDDLIDVIGEAYFIEIYEPKQNLGIGCKLGNCETNYGHYTYSDFQEEGEYSNGGLNGFGIRTFQNASLVGFFKDGTANGLGYMYLKEENQLYKVSYKMGDVIDIEELGFVEENLSEKEIDFDFYIQNKSEKSIINIKEIDDEEFEKIQNIKTGK